MRRLVPLLCVLVLAAGTPAGAAATPSGQHASATGPDEADYRIPFRSGVVDPAVDLDEHDPAGADLVLVQWSSFGRPGIVSELAGTGAELVQPLAPVSYIVWADAAQTAALRALADVRFAGVLPSDARLGTVTAETEVLRVTTVGPGSLPVLTATARGQVAMPDLEVLGATDRAFTAVEGRISTVLGGQALATALANHPRVYSVADAGSPALRDERSAQVSALGTEDGAVTMPPRYRDYLADLGADGTGVVISNVDGGVDSTHPDLGSGAVEACFDYISPLGSDSPMCTAGNTDDVIGHGTHTIGISIGRGATASPPLSLTDDDGFELGLGMAPGATGVIQNAINAATIPGDIVGFGPFADGYTPVYTDAFRAGATISGNSWGPSGTPQGYDANTREFDTIVRDADPETAGNQEMTLVFSIMNGSGGTSTQGAPDEAKNIIGVGGTGSRGGPGEDDLCTCTAHGPALDGRLLPDLVAPGQNVISTRASQATLCGVPSEDAPSPYHSACTGTSMASPHVTGGAAVFTEFARNDFDLDPSPAMIKAAFVNGADDLAGNLDADGAVMGPIPNNQQGWGRFNLGNVTDAWRAGVVFTDQDIVFTETGEQHSVTVDMVDPSQPLKATLAWTDAPGPGLGGTVPAWVNDLDLAVIAADGTTWKGNVFDGGASTTGGSHDRRNNVENVFLPDVDPADGPFTITVRAANLIGQALPDDPRATTQDFALVVTGATAVSDGSTPPPTTPDPPSFVRLSGPERIATAADVARRLFAQADTALLATAEEYADALSGAPLAAHHGAPILLTNQAVLPPVTAAALGDLGVTEVVVLGGQVAVSEEVVADLRDRGFAVSRVAGPDRFATAAAVAGVLPASDEVVIAEGANADPGRGWPDALSGAGLAATARLPVLLTTRDVLPEATATRLAEHTRATVIGGPVAVSDAVVADIAARVDEVTRLSGPDRYATSAAVAREVRARGLGGEELLVASGRNWPDGLVAGAAAGRGATLVLVDSSDLDASPATRDLMIELRGSITSVVIVGGQVAVADTVADQVQLLFR